MTDRDQESISSADFRAGRLTRARPLTAAAKVIAEATRATFRPASPPRGVPSDVFEVEAPVRIRSENEIRRAAHRQVAATQVRRDRATVTQAMTATVTQRALLADLSAFVFTEVDVERPAKLEITMTRIAPRNIRDDDNLRGGFKGAKDAVAALLGIDDGDLRLTWAYAQEKAKTCGVRIRIEGRQ